MDNRQFKKWNMLTAVAVLLVSGFTYLSTMEPTASFWDCGEFIASSYKLEVGHPPGNPVFQLIARFFTMFGGASHAAVMVNAMSAVCSAFTIFFLYLTIVFFAKRLVPRKGPDGEDGYSTGGAVAIMGSGAVGALAYTFSDTFWFSAVEGEVYAMSSLFTAMVVWAMTRWYEETDRRYSNRWIVLISFLMGLSIGVHLLNLLAIPFMVFMYYYREREDKPLTFWEIVKILLLSVAILGFVVFIFVPLFPKVAAFFDRIFVNGFHAPYNLGAALFMAAVLGLCFWGLFSTLRKGKVLWNTLLLCFTSVVVGFSLFSIVIIRSCAKTPTNEYQPDNPYTLVRYLSREQYGSAPLLYGQYFGAPYETVFHKDYWAPLKGRYEKVQGPTDVTYPSDAKMFFPRMWSNDERHIAFYQTYTDGKGIPVKDAQYKKPTFGANLRFFFDFQLGWMYWRYFMWNFAGRQNEIHSPSGDLFTGNWESGIKFIDRIHLYDQDDAPDYLKDNPGKNHLYLLPLLLGLLGLVFQFDRDKRGSWLVFLLFILTGVAIVVYLNQPPYQVRERDYAYAGSFYAFSIWIGFAVAAIYSWVDSALKGRGSVVTAAVTTAACLGVPALMCAQEWDDHDRSNRYTAVEVARNYLNSVEKNGLLVTHGDNDTFPLWYVQEVEGFRNDVRICNTSLLGTDWYIDQMKYASNNSPAIKLSIGQEQYLYGTNEWIPIQDKRGVPVSISDAIAVFKEPKARIQYSDGTLRDYWVSRKLVIPVNRENCVKSGILSEKYLDQIPESIVLEIPESKTYLTKPELFILDFLSNYEWDRPLNLLNQGGDLDIGLKDYLMFEGYSFKFIPLRNKVTSLDPGLVDTDDLYSKMTTSYSWDAISRDDYFIDHQNMYTNLGVMSVRTLFVNAAEAFIDAGENDRALEMLDKCQEVMKPERFPYENTFYGWTSNIVYPINMVRQYYILGQGDKARALADGIVAESKQTFRFLREFYDYGNCSDSFSYLFSYMQHLVKICDDAGDTEYSNEVAKDLGAFIKDLD